MFRAKYFSQVFVFLFCICEIEAKCYCTYPLSEQKNGTMKSSNEIMCETTGGLQPSGQCEDDEYCAGPNTLEDAVCGKKLLCNKKDLQNILIA